ncbi:hypothetical protein [Mesorhizobium sp.]|uniref:hypothetical protein n=1 Tax=Mesorhizobium sp. TaxID=1871066 RepID=UPI000FE79B44|nr:hypothetical protein [Mesorhizobium sp.]RWA98303.1 MAG: hypothetical protein EOQ33_27690 [Mesorhizobium sp.]RWD28657.1 MAG: hypothetical protein EOS34_29585 [Mesorhizobium sp.]RWE98575.1 MAG: hypothetical protein EOS43_17315 [Mesorhizobium sp.]
MKKRQSTIGMMIMLGTTTSIAIASEPTIVSCQFEKMPPMILIFRGGMGANDNTLQVGQTKPVPLSVGSSLMTAEYGAQEFVFSLRLPANVSVSAPGQDTQTFYGECVSTLQQ